MFFARPNHSLAYAVLLVCAAYGTLRFIGTGIMEAGLAVIWLALAAYNVLDYFLRRRSEERIREYQESQEDFKIIDTFRMMSAEQIEAIQEARVVRTHIFPRYGDHKHRWMFPTSMNEPVQEFSTDEIKAVWNVCNEYNFAPLSTWNEGTRNRMAAQALYTYCLANAWLLPWNGNQTATWKEGGYERASANLWGG